MIWVDIVLLGIIVLSIIISFLRGFVREAISLVVWIAAFWIGLRFSPQFAAVLPDFIAVGSLRVAAAFLILFLGVMVLGVAINFVVGRMISATLFKGPDRVMGMLFGLIRGLVVVVVLVTLGTMTPLADSGWWRKSVVIDYCEPLVKRLRGTMAEGDAVFGLAPVQDFRATGR